MSFRGHKPVRLPRMGSLVDSDAPTVTVPGLANVAQNVRYDEQTVGPRYGTKVGPSMTAGNSIRGLDVRTVLARTSGLPSHASASITANFVNSSQAIGTVNLGKAFELLDLLVGASCRVRLYRTAAGRNADLARNVSTVYVGSDLIFDLNADGTYSFPLTFACLNNPGTFNIPLGVATAYWTVDTYGPAVGSAWAAIGDASGIYFDQIQNNALDGAHVFGDRFNEWDFSVAPLIVPGNMLRIHASTFYDTEAIFYTLPWSTYPAAYTGAIVSTVTPDPILAGASVDVLVPAGAGAIRCYAKTGHFTDASQFIELAGTVSRDPINITFDELIYA